NAPNAGFLLSWTDPLPYLDVSLGTTVTNATGDGTAYTVLFDTANIDHTSAYNSGTGKITVGSQRAGIWEVNTSVMVNSLTTSFTNMQLDIIQKNQAGSTVS